MTDNQKPIEISVAPSDKTNIQTNIENRINSIYKDLFLLAFNASNTQSELRGNGYLTLKFLEKYKYGDHEENYTGFKIDDNVEFLKDILNIEYIKELFKRPEYGPPGIHERVELLYKEISPPKKSEYPIIRV